MIHSRLALAAVLTLTLAQTSPVGLTLAAQSPSTVDPSYLNLMRWRSVGPSRGGRVVAVAGDPVNKFTFYQGTTGGGVWKTEDGGLNWANVSDGFFSTGSVGAMSVAPSNPNIVYVGMGEACFRGNASYGDGVYKSADAGKTWTKLGLEATRQIGRLQVHPTNPDIAYVAALGDAWGPNPERGVYRYARRRTDVAARPLQERECRRHRPGAGSRQPGCHLCVHARTSSLSVGLPQRRARHRPLQVHRRRRHLGRPEQPAWPPEGRQGPDRHRAGAVEAQPRVGHHRRRRHRQGHLPFRGRRPDVGPSHRQR